MVTVATALPGMALEQLLDEPGGFEFVELLHSLAEPIHCEPLDVMLVELVLIHDLDDELLLLGRAVPGIPGTVVGRAVTVAVAWGGVTVAVGVCRSDAGREPTGQLELAVHAGLQEAVEPLAFRADLAEVAQLRAEREQVLMAAVAGESDLLAVVGLEDDGHGVLGLRF